MELLNTQFERLLSLTDFRTDAQLYDSMSLYDGFSKQMLGFLSALVFTKVVGSTAQSETDRSRVTQAGISDLLDGGISSGNRNISGLTHLSSHCRRVVFMSCNSLLLASASDLTCCSSCFSLSFS